MSAYIEDADFRLYHGDVLEVLAGLPDESVHCVVTSPPYWGLRDYGTGSWDGGDPDCDHSPEARGGRFASPVSAKQASNTGSGTASSRDCPCGARRVDHQLGLEPTPDLYVQNMVAVFREVRRVLRRDGTCWLNIGDSYAANRSYQVSDGKHKTHDFKNSNAMSVPDGLKPKDLVGIPWRLAFALQADGWYLRADIIWAKPNPMPESVTDRPTKAHEYVFLLTRSPRYFFDAEAIREEYAPKTLTHRGGGKAAGKVGQQDGTGKVASGNFGEWDKPRTAYPPPKPQDETLDGSDGEAPRGPDGRRATAVKGGDGSIQHRDGERWPNGGRNVRSVWEIATQPYAEAHFATFPEALVERCIRAGTSERGCCPVCGAPWERETERTPMVIDRSSVSPYDHHSTRASGRMLAPAESATTGWHPSCECGEGSSASVRGHGRELGACHQPTSPCVVLDPFMGSGTTALVARRLGRKAIGVELNPVYCALAARRLQQLSLLAI